MLKYLELHEKNKPLVDMLTIDEKAALLELLLEYGVQELSIEDIDADIYRNNRAVALTYQAIINDNL